MQAVRSFNDDADTKCMVMQASTSAAGLTLTVAKTVFLLEPFNGAGQEAQVGFPSFFLPPLLAVINPLFRCANHKMIGLESRASHWTDE